MTRTRTITVLMALGLGASLAGTPVAAEEPGLKDAAPPGMLIGVALGRDQTTGQDPHVEALVPGQFDSLTLENELKWERVHPEPDRYDFGPADRAVAFGEKHGMAVIGHVLLWHQQTPAWVFAGEGGKPLDRETALRRLRAHIQTVAGRYKGRIKGWDVVNEAVNDDGTLRQTPWLEAIGEDYLARAFEYAREADPGAELYYNDYNVYKPEKRAAILKLVSRLRKEGLRVDGVGAQGHWLLGDPSFDRVETMITDISAAGFKVLITELDVDPLPRDPRMYGADLSLKTQMGEETNIYADGLPPEKQQELAEYYGGVFRVFVKHRDDISRVTFWALTDADTWLNGFPVPGRVNHPMLWDRDGRPKPAFDAVLAALQAR
ncbi:MAG: endo-1,4-beta-xylanase [Acidobacteria bacterium]|nr:endo-1,4-beta-xylanase [Acidobacteriota bacterium]